MGNTPQGPYGKPPSGQPTPLGDGEFTPASYNRKIHFAKCELDPPPSIYVTVDDQIVTEHYSTNSGDITFLNVRMILPGGREQIIKATQVWGTSGTMARQSIPLPEGFILSVTVQGGPNFQAGQYTFCGLHLARGEAGTQQMYQELWEGYVSFYFPRGWPTSLPKTVTDGAGFLSATNLGSVTAGTDISVQFNGGFRTQLIAISGLLTASATVANRFPVLQIATSSGAVIAYFPPQAAQTAGQAITYSWAGVGSTLATVNGVQAVASQMPIWIPNGGFVKTATANLQAGDQWTLVVYEIMQWFDLL